MTVVYFIQTHSNPKQIYRLVNIIKKSSPESFVLLSHDFTNSHLDTATFSELSKVKVLKLKNKGGRGDFSMLQAYLDAVDWLFENNIDFDWLTNLTGQDYPTRSLSETEKFLTETEYDGFLEYFEAFSEQAGWGIRESQDRYLYQYWRSWVHLAVWQRALLKVPKTLINNLQPWIRIYWSYDGLMVGRRAKSTPFKSDFTCYAGSYFHTLSRQCVEYLSKFSISNREIVDYYKKTCVPVESYIQTVLVNSGLFNLCNNPKRYIDWTGTRHGRPCLLTSKDYAAIVNSDAHFARKFDMNRDSRILDRLDAVILPSPTEAISSR